MAVSSIPARLQIEPVDPVAYDRWMDAEGMLDASDGCRDAWMAFKSVWRGARAAELRRELPRPPKSEDWLGGLPRGLQTSANHARDLGSRFGLCSATHRKRELTAERRSAFWRWRSRVLRHDPDAWWCLFSLLDGQPLGLLAVRHDRSVQHIEGTVRVALGWLIVELGHGESYGLQVRQMRGGRHRVEGRALAAQPSPAARVPHGVAAAPLTR